MFQFVPITQILTRITKSIYIYLITQKSSTINALIPIDSQLEESKSIHYNTKSKFKAKQSIIRTDHMVC